MQHHLATMLAGKSRFLPDAKFIRREIPIAEVAVRLELKGNRRYFDCWRDHPPHKRKRLLSVHPLSNTFRCFTCDKRSLSNIDLVRLVKGCDVGTAIRWFDRNFSDIPRVEVRIKRNRKRYAQSRTRAFTLQNLVTSPGWKALSPAAKIVLTAVFSRTPAAGNEQTCLRCTYTRLQEWTGFRSRATIAAALQELRNTKAVQTSTVPTNVRTRRGFWLKELSIRVSPRAMRAPRHIHATATSYSVQKMNLQYTVQKMNSESNRKEHVPGREGLEKWKPAVGEHVQ